MLYEVENILKEVRICLDQNKTGNALLATGDVDTLTLDEIIRSHVVDGVKRVEVKAPVYMLEQGHNFPVYDDEQVDDVFWDGDGMCSGHVLLPDDFMRLVVFEMSDWSRAVYSAITPDEPLYQQQSSKWKGIRGTAEKPVCALCVRPEGKVLEFYSCKSEDATVTRGVYIPYPKIDRDGYIDISEKCYRACVLMIAALTMMSQGDTERGKMLAELADSELA